MFIAPMTTTIHAPVPTLPPIRREFRGAWIATVDNIDWPLRRGESPAVEKFELDQIVSRAKNLHLNCLIFQVRPSADALYESKLEPWSEYLTGKQGVAPNPIWDPLNYLISNAHRQGIQVQAWFNPYRAMSPAQKGPNAASHISNTHPDAVMKYGDFIWMDPGSKFVQDRTANVILDVVKRYDVDGVHFDDYFYPYPVKGKDGKEEPFPDDRTYNAYRNRGGTLDRGDWRRQNVNRLIERVSHGVKALKPWVLFGVSPFGIYRPGEPASIKAGVDQYAQLYADPLKWLQSGWVDYIAPQLYWPIDQKAQSFRTLLNWWISVDTLHRHVWPGMYTDLVRQGKFGVNEILNQMALVKASDPRNSADPETLLNEPKSKAGQGEENGASGEIHFSFKVFMIDPAGLNQKLLAGPYKEAAVPPFSPWLDAPAKVPMKLTVSKNHGQKSIHFTPETQAETFGYCELGRGGTWGPWHFSGEAEVEAGSGTIAVVTIDRFGQISKPKIIR